MEKIALMCARGSFSCCGNDGAPGACIFCAVSVSCDIAFVCPRRRRLRRLVNGHEVGGGLSARNQSLFTGSCLNRFRVTPGGRFGGVARMRRLNLRSGISRAVDFSEFSMIME